MPIGEDNGGNRRTIIVADKEQSKWSLFILPADPNTDERYLAHPGGNNPIVTRPGGLGDIDASLEGGYYLEKVPFNIFLTTDFFSNGPCDLIIESPHLRFKNEKSKAQIFSLGQLETLHGFQNGNDNLRIFVFPHALTDRARIELGLQPYHGANALEKAAAKKCDTEAICWFALNRQEVRLRLFNPIREIPTSNRREPMQLTEAQYQEHRTREQLIDFRNNSNERLNIMRTHGYKMNSIQSSQFNADIWDQIDHALRILDDAYGDLPEDEYPDVSSVFNIVRERFNPTHKYLRGRLNRLNDEIPIIRLSGNTPQLKERLRGLGVIVPPTITLGGSAPQKRQRLRDLGEKVADDATGIVCRARLLALQDAYPTPDRPWCIAQLRALQETFPRIPTDGNKEVLRERLEELGEQIPEFTGRIYRGGSPGRHNNVRISLDAIMAVYVCVFDDDGHKRVRQIHEDNRRAKVELGVDFIWTRLLMMTSYHGRLAGVARSNLMYHVLGKKFELRGLEDYDQEADHNPSRRFIMRDQDEDRTTRRQADRRRFRNAVKAMIRTFKSSTVAYQVAAD